MVAGFFGLIVIYLPFAGIGAFSSAGLLPLLGVPLFIAGLACIPHQSTAAGRWVAPALVDAALLIVPVGKGLSSFLCEVVVHVVGSRRPGKVMANALNACFHPWVPVPSSPPLLFPMLRIAK